VISLVRRLPLAAFASLACALGAAPAAEAWPVVAKRVVSSRDLAPAVSLARYRLTLAGGAPAQDFYRVSWPLGNRHVGLHAELRGSFDPATRSVGNDTISSWASWGAPRGFLAGMTGDFSTPLSPRDLSRSRVSGLLVHGRNVYSFGWGGPAVGFEADGRFLMGAARAVPARIPLPGSSTATIGAWNPRAADLPQLLRGDQVAVYTVGGSTVRIPAGFVGVAVRSGALPHLLHGRKQGVKNSSGLGVSETVVAFRFDLPGAPTTRISMPVVKPAACAAGTCPAGSRPRVPRGGALIVAKAAPALAGAGLAARAQAATPPVAVLVDDGRWGGVHDVAGGKPLLVHRGQPVQRQPDSVDDWQWTCNGGCWRTALARTRDGRGWLVVSGEPGGYGGGLTMRTFAAVLADMGVTEALGFDANNSAELYMPARRPITGYGYERRLPTLTAVTYR